MKKRLFAMMLALVMCTMFLAACGGDSSSADPAVNTPPASEVDASAPAASDNGEVVKLTFHTLIPTQRDEAEVFEAVNAILREKVGAEVEFIYHGGSYADKIQVIMASGEEYDACFTANWINSYTLAVSKGAFLDISSMLPEVAPKLYEAVPDYFWEAATIEGGVYAVPNQQIAARTPIIFLPEPYVTETGVDYENLHKLEDYEPYIQQVFDEHAVKTQLVNRTQVGDYLGYEYITDYLSCGAIKMTDTAAQVVNLYETEEWLGYLNMVRGLYEKGLVDADFLTQDDYSENQRKAMKMSLLISGTYKPGVEAEESARAGYSVLAGRIETPPYLSTSGLIATMYGVSATSKNPEKTLQVLEVINTDPEVFNLLANGIEGKHYTKTGDNSIETVEDGGYLHGQSWAVGNVFNGYTLPGQEATVWEDTKALNDSAARSPILGFAFDPEPVKMQLTSVSKVVNEYISIASGALPVEETNAAFNEKLKTAGLDDVLAEMQKQVDAFLAG